MFSLVSHTLMINVETRAYEAKKKGEERRKEKSDGQPYLMRSAPGLAGFENGCLDSSDAFVVFSHL